ncbi:MAG: multifunctional CCA addition/repair protein [Burkholderiaceae bacterium]|jgi:tRNA nucleotidyltransferase (CCA-adding enzyme)|nr:multifunctional CCA addition/repair protein [Burkholderiaceae bacterium]
MQIYRVGGSVRDALLGLTVKDRDWVVVGATPGQMSAQGFVLVGRDFPVFLHPQTHEEYALARTERKSGHGYRGFVVCASPDVTLQDDLARRDLTINAMAAPADWLPLPAAANASAGAAPVDARLIDPFGGQRDLQARVLRHVSAAFCEDPVRILRVARFAARFADFSVAPETLALMRRMVADGAAAHLVAERVWQELARGLMEPQPARMLQVLRACGALAVVLPEVDRLWGVPQRADYHPEVDAGEHVLLVLQMAAQLQAPLPVRYACLTHDLGKASTPAGVLPHHHEHEARGQHIEAQLAQRLRVPGECHALAQVVTREHGNIHRSDTLDAEAVLRLLTRCDALRKSARFAQALLACECDARGRAGQQGSAYPQRARLLRALEAALAVDSAPIAAAAQAGGARGKAIGQAVARARVQAIARALARQRADS